MSMMKMRTGAFLAVLAAGFVSASPANAAFLATYNFNSGTFAPSTSAAGLTASNITTNMTVGAGDGQYSFASNVFGNPSTFLSVNAAGAGFASFIEFTVTSNSVLPINITSISYDYALFGTSSGTSTQIQTAYESDGGGLQSLGNQNNTANAFNTFTSANIGDSGNTILVRLTFKDSNVAGRFTFIDNLSLSGDVGIVTPAPATAVALGMAMPMMGAFAALRRRFKATA